MRHTIIICFITFFIQGLHPALNAQDSSYKPAKKSKSNGKVRTAADNLKRALATNDELQTAKEYEIFANELIQKEEYSKAEENLNKAKDIYTKLGINQQVVAILRSLAKVQELQRKIKPAIENYESAAEQSKDSNLEKVNLNDANRLRSINPKEQQNFAENNAVIFEKEGKKEEASNAYKQVAESQILQKNTIDALTNFKKAIEVNPDPKEVAVISNKMATVYASDNQLEKAIALAESVLSDAEKNHDTEQQIDQLQILSKLFDQKKDFQQSISLLKEAYNLCAVSGNTVKAKNCVLMLTEFYERHNQTNEAKKIYQTFLNNLDSIIKKDSSLIDARLFEITEDRIKELEKEKTLQNELITRTTRFNYFLIGSLVFMGLLLFLIIRALYAIRIKNKRIALQSLRREMNPHFIFNSLNSINQYIAENNELEANKYLTSYSSLMRNIMENSGKDLVTLSVEIDQLNKYLALEHQRFREKFDYIIKVSEEIDVETTLIPNMLIQPHIENAVWHGLRYKDGKGKLLLEFQKNKERIYVIITDDGIGITQSKLLKTKNQKIHQSRGMNNTIERISLLNDIYKTNIDLKIEELTINGTGTQITLSMPIMIKK